MQHVEVRTRYSGEWVGGFEVVERGDSRESDGPARVTVRRRSDGLVLPEPFGPEEIRPER